MQPHRESPLQRILCNVKVLFSRNNSRKLLKLVRVQYSYISLLEERGIPSNILGELNIFHILFNIISEDKNLIRMLEELT